MFYRAIIVRSIGIILAVQPKYNPHKASTKKEPQQRTRRKDYHWMAWPSPSPTPAPSRPATARPQSARPASTTERQVAAPATPQSARPASCASARPMSRRQLAAQMIPRPASAVPQVQAESAAARPETPAARPCTPRPVNPDTPSIPPTPLTPEPAAAQARCRPTSAARPASAARNHSAARPASAASNRSATPCIDRATTPREFDPSYRDVMEAQVTNEAALRPPSTNDTTYVPALKAWVTNANDYGQCLIDVLSCHELCTGVNALIPVA